MKILITGATGYIGRRLKDYLLKESDCSIRLLVRNKNKVRPSVLDRVEVVEGDTFQEETLAQACKGVEVAFYLIHSMGAKGGDFARLDRKSAKNFRRACIAAKVKRIVYLGGLGVKETASRHLMGRIETGEILSARPGAIQTIWFRAGVIIGSGSASFEIIRNLVQKLPLMTTPRWVSTQTLPIAVDDVISYLASAIRLPERKNLVVDIGSQAMTFKNMLLEAAKAMALNRFIIPVPVLTPRLSSYWLVFCTPVPLKMATALIEGLKSPTLIQNDNAWQFFPKIQPISFAESIERAIMELEQNQVLSRWCDSSAGEVCDIKDQTDIDTAILHDRRTFFFGATPHEKIFAAACSVGGEQGWFNFHVLWRLRGLMDKLLGGYGLSRGRRQAGQLRVGDALDFWKVADIKKGKRLLLLAQMKLPGKAWLEFDIKKDHLIQTAHFYPKGVWGRLYWYAVLPFHHLVFKDLGEQIVAQAKK